MERGACHSADSSYGKVDAPDFFNALRPHRHGDHAPTSNVGLTSVSSAKRYEDFDVGKYRELSQVALSG